MHVNGLNCICRQQSNPQELAARVAGKDLAAFLGRLKTCEAAIHVPIGGQVMRGSLVVSTNIGHRMRARARTFAGRSVARDAPPLRAEGSGADELITPKRPQKSEREEMMAEADTGPKRKLRRCQGIAADKVLGIAWNAPAEEVKTFIENAAAKAASSWAICFPPKAVL